jgi:hypothetical protein
MVLQSGKRGRASVARTCLLWLAIAVWPVPVSAQPLFRYEHDWTITVGDHMYGLREVVQMPGGWRWTQVWVGQHSFNTRFRAGEVVTLALRAPAVAVLVLAISSNTWAVVAPP